MTHRLDVVTVNPVQCDREDRGGQAVERKKKTSDPFCHCCDRDSFSVDKWELMIHVDSS